MASRTVFILALLAAFMALAAAQFTIRDTEDADLPASVEPEMSPSGESEDSEDRVCVDEKYLRALGHTTADFVHRAGVVATALCPPNGLPCGTAHHKIRVAGKDMSYAQLCESVSCASRAMTVNSVYAHRWTEKVHGDAVLTMFDARHFETAQKALHFGMAAVRRVVRA